MCFRCVELTDFMHCGVCNNPTLSVLNIYNKNTNDNDANFKINDNNNAKVSHIKLNSKLKSLGRKCCAPKRSKGRRVTEFLLRITIIIL